MTLDNNSLCGIVPCIGGWLTASRSSTQEVPVARFPLPVVTTKNVSSYGHMHSGGENIAPGEDRITGLLCNSASWPAATPCPQGRSFLFVCVKPVGFQCSDKEEEEAASHSPRPHFFIFVVKRCLHSTHTRCSQWQQECPFTLQNNPLPSSVLVLCTFSIFAFLF